MRLLRRPVSHGRRVAIRTTSALGLAGLAGAAFADSIPPSSPGPAALSDQSGQTPACLAAVPARLSPSNPAPFALPQLATPQFRADASATPSATKSPGPWGAFSGDWQNQNLLGDMGGLRPALAKYGVTLTILENVELFGNVSGGVTQGLEPKGLTTVTLQMDTEKAFGLKGGTLNVSGLQDRKSVV